MEKSKEVILCKRFFYNLGRFEKIKIIKNSNLDNRERKIIYSRFVEGMTLKEIAENLSLGIDNCNKIQKKAFVKLYSWLERNAKLQGTTLKDMLIKG